MQPERIYAMLPHVDIASNTETKQVRESFPWLLRDTGHGTVDDENTALVGLAVAPGAPHNEAGGGGGWRGNSRAHAILIRTHVDR